MILKHYFKKNKYWAIVGLMLVFACQNSREVKHKQYLAEGAVLYKNNCANCHQNDGSGLAGLYPALNTDKQYKDDELICLIRKGKMGSDSSQAMPGNEALHALEIAELVVFVKSKMKNDTALIAVETVEELLQKCKK